jgi:hypothetical protein
MKSIVVFLMAATVAVLACGFSSAAIAQDKVVYHIDTTTTQALKGPSQYSQSSRYCT